MVFSGNASGGGQMQPMAVPADGRAPHRVVLSAPARLIVHDVAPDGRWLAVREDLTFGVRVRVPGIDGERELSWLGSSGARSLSADGRHLLMVDVGQRSGANYGVVLRATDGSQPMRLGAGSAERLSPDGRWAAAILASPPEVVLYPTGPGTPRRLGGGRFDPISSVQWFPDGQQVLVCGTENGRLPRCYRTDLGGTTSPRSPTRACRAALGARWAHAAAHDARRQPCAWPPSASRRRGRSTSLRPPIASWAGAATARAVYVQRGFEVPVRVERVDLATGERTLARTLAPAGVDDPATRHGRRLVRRWPCLRLQLHASPSVLFVVTGVASRDKRQIVSALWAPAAGSAVSVWPRNAFEENSKAERLAEQIGGVGRVRALLRVGPPEAADEQPAAVA